MRFYKRFVFPKQRKPMTHFRMRMPLIVATVVAASILGVPGKARAEFELQISTTGGPPFGPPISDGGTGTISTSYNGVSIVAMDVITSGYSALDLAFGPNTTSSVYNLNNLVIQVSMNDIITPPGQLFSYTFTNQSSITLGVTIQTWINSSNALFDTTGNLANSGSQNVTTTPTDEGLNSVNGSSSFSGSVTGYSLTTQISFSGEAANVNIDDYNAIVPSPAPGGLLLALTSLPLLSFRAWSRRKGN
jgi:hypothetical protein